MRIYKALMVFAGLVALAGCGKSNVVKPPVGHKALVVNSELIAATPALQGKNLGTPVEGAPVLCAVFVPNMDAKRCAEDVVKESATPDGTEWASTHADPQDIVARFAGKGGAFVAVLPGDPGVAGTGPEPKPKPMTEAECLAAHKGLIAKAAVPTPEGCPLPPTQIPPTLNMQKLKAVDAKGADILCWDGNLVIAVKEGKKGAAPTTTQPVPSGEFEVIGVDAGNPLDGKTVVPVLNKDFSAKIIEVKADGTREDFTGAEVVYEVVKDEASPSRVVVRVKLAENVDPKTFFPAGIKVRKFVLEVTAMVKGQAGQEPLTSKQEADFAVVKETVKGRDVVGVSKKILTVPGASKGARGDLFQEGRDALKKSGTP
ncbi:MAG: hypothetical protein NT099_05915 [Candidatus Saganbacteria bacterium]|nr:hypothetical protein [Candidatus Saganbacteria bacterium]